MKMNRRDFLKISAITAGAVVVVAGGGGSAIYLMSKDMDFLDMYVEAAKDVLTARFGDSVAQTILKDSWQEYQTLLPEVPYIGGEENCNSENLLMASYNLAMYRVIKARGQTTEEVGRIIYEASEATAPLPKWLLRLYGRLKYDEDYQDYMRAQATQSQKRQYPGDWVFTFVEGDGEEFDYGLDFSECGIVKLFHAQGADELTPYMCLSDHVKSSAFNTGLVRYKTLAEGAGVCDFRFKRGREAFVYPLRDGWPPQFL